MFACSQQQPGKVLFGTLNSVLLSKKLYVDKKWLKRDSLQSYKHLMSTGAALPSLSPDPGGAFECHRSALWSWPPVAPSWRTIKQVQKTNTKGRKSAQTCWNFLFSTSTADSMFFIHSFPPLSTSFQAFLSFHWLIIGHTKAPRRIYVYSLDWWEGTYDKGHSFLMGGSKQGWTDKQSSNDPRWTLDGATELHNWAAVTQKLHIHRCLILHR